MFACANMRTLLKEIDDAHGCVEGLQSIEVCTRCIDVDFGGLLPVSADVSKNASACFPKSKSR